MGLCGCACHVWDGDYRDLPAAVKRFPHGLLLTLASFLSGTSYESQCITEQELRVQIHPRPWAETLTPSVWVLKGWQDIPLF